MWKKKKLIHGVKIGRRVKTISHLFSADDSLLFVRATEEEVENVNVFSTYEAATGQKLNAEKSKMSYKRNLESEKINTLQIKSAFKAVEEHDKYLGLPTYIGSSKKEFFKLFKIMSGRSLRGGRGDVYLKQVEKY